MSALPHFFQPVSSDRALEVLTNSMWSTMMITGIFFMSFLFVFLSIKVGQSIGAESIDTGPVEISFLFSFSGIRYMYNHVRHHLFETPLLPRRRFSSLSASWLPGILKRTSFTSRNRDIFSEENGLSLGPEKSRRNSSSLSESHTSRRSSTSSKSKRLSVPHIQAPRNTINANPKSIMQPTTVANEPTKTKPISRRNTLPNLSISTELLKNSNNTTEKNIQDTTECPKLITKNDDVLPRENVSLSIIHEEDLTETLELPQTEQQSIIKDTNLMPIIEEESLDELENNDSLFSDIHSDISDPITDDDTIIDSKEVEAEIIQKPSESIKIEPRSSPNSLQLNLESSSPKTSSSFRSAYFNYLPDSIFGYSTSMLKSNIVSGSPPVDSCSAPPGFSKRSASHDLTNSVSTGFSITVNEEFNNHQPLYARRRTETSKMLSEAAKSFIPFNMPSFSSNHLHNSDSEPNRSNTASPCLSDLQNTDDLFAPINWNFSASEQSEALRKSWDAVDEDEISETELKSVTDSCSTSTAFRRKSTSFSSLFEGY